MKNYLLILSFLGTITFSLAQNGVPNAAGARGLAMGDAFVAGEGIYSAWSNQAGLHTVKGFGVAVHGEQRFLLTDVTAASFVAAYGTSSGTFALSGGYYGFSEYNETKVGIAYSRQLAEFLSIGAQFDYIGFRIPEYGSSANFTFELGMRAKLTESIYIGAHFFSPIRQEVVAGEYLPTVVRFGAAYQPSDKVLVTAEFEKDMDYPIVVKAGAEYYLVDQFCIRLGFRGAEGLLQNSFGIGLRLNNGLHIDLASSYHYSLGFTPAASIAFDIPSNKKS